ncbi:MAG: ferrous iron transport protein B [Planctomycetes bacterium]|nr:ferrous iron transport protein B [Planctomycetota bacterium]
MHDHKSGRKAADTVQDVILLGNPNVGKSVIFSLLTGKYAIVSNYPGTTIEVAYGTILGSKPKTRIIDTPGVNNLIPMSEDEKVTRDILLSSPAKAVIQVADAKNLKRALLISVQLAEMRVPFVLVLNLWDEALDRRISIDTAKLSELLGVPVITTIATQKWGTDKIFHAIDGAKPGLNTMLYEKSVEESLLAIENELHGDFLISRRSIALMLLSGDVSLKEWLSKNASKDGIKSIEDVVDNASRRFSQNLGYLINKQRLAFVDGILAQVYREEPGFFSKFQYAVARITMHPFWGLLFLALVMYVMYIFVGKFGAGTAVDFLQNTFFGEWINPVLVKFCRSFMPERISDFFVGQYGLFTMAFTYALAIILPIVFSFFVFFGVLEDTGYLPRLTVVSNKIFKVIGLNGKAILPMVLGLGCGSMATLTTRILETKRERIIVTVLLAVGVPCSAQLGVIFALLSAIPIKFFLVWFGMIFFILLLSGILASRIIPGESADFIMELPPVRIPQMWNIVLKTVSRMRWYLKEAVPLFILGTVLLFFMDSLGILRLIEYAAKPVITGLLGLPGRTTEAFIVGFLRRDYGAAGLKSIWEGGLMTPDQLVTSLVTITLFVPCVAHFFITIKERGWRSASLIFMVSLIAAIAGGLLTRMVLLLL